MTIQELKNCSMDEGMEGLGGYYWEFNADLFASNLIDEFVKWAKPALGMSSIDEKALREHLGV